MITVMKFGGTSMGTAESLGQVAEIVMACEGQKAVVVSASSGTTDKLIALGEAAVGGGDWEMILAEIRERHEKMVKDLGVELSPESGLGSGLGKFWEDLRKLCDGIAMTGEFSLSTRDRLIGFGERISSEILAALLRKRAAGTVAAEAVDAYEMVFTDNNFSEGNVNFGRSNEAIVARLMPMLKGGVIPVITGFVGQSENGHYITLGRGGSDYSGAIVAAALGAGELQIWTDVDGILNSDPRLVPEAKVLPQLSFNEAGELAYFGAKVLHPKTIKPAISKNIPVKILNTFNPGAPGTLITNRAEESLKSVTYKKGITIINICSVGMFLAHGFLATLFKVFEKYTIPVDVVSTSEVSVSLTVDTAIPEALIEELKKFATVDVYEGMAIVCLVGEGIRANTKVLGDLFTAIADHDVSMVSQGASKRNITFLVKEAEAPEVVKKTFKTFFNQ